MRAKYTERSQQLDGQNRAFKAPRQELGAITS